MRFQNSRHITPGNARRLTHGIINNNCNYADVHLIAQNEYGFCSSLCPLTNELGRTDFKNKLLLIFTSHNFDRKLLLARKLLLKWINFCISV